MLVLASENNSEWHSVLTTLFQQRAMGRILVRHMYESLFARLQMLATDERLEMAAGRWDFPQLREGNAADEIPSEELSVEATCIFNLQMLGTTDQVVREAIELAKNTPSSRP